MIISLAPMQGLTTYLFRNAWSDSFTGLDLAYTPFIPCVTGTKVKPTHIKDALPENNRFKIKIVPQILGNEPGSMKLMSDAFFDLGYAEMNWNLGCPSSTVMKKTRGCALMQHPNIIENILEHLFADMKIKLSVKLRSGVSFRDDIFNVISVLNKYPVHKIILHPRLASQMYSGKPDIETFAEVIARSKHPLVYSGNISSKPDLIKLMHRFPLQNEWMLGRGVLMDPFLPSKIKGIRKPGISTTRELLFKLHNDLKDNIIKAGNSEARTLAKIKEHWNYFSYWFKNRNFVWYKVSRSENLEKLNIIVKNSFDKEEIRLE